MEFATILFTAVELASCIAMFLLAKWVMNNAKPTVQWYDKNDTSIRKPFVPPTFSVEMITYGSLFAPYVPMIGIYLYDASLLHPRIPLRYLFAWALSGLVCYIIKGWVGRLRPNFLVLNGDQSIEGHEIFARVVKQNKPSVRKLFEIESRKSFYSGHATVGAVAGSFTGILLHSIFPRCNVLLSLVKVFVVLLGLYPGITQGICHFHHWSDVIVGQLTGTLFAYFSFYYVE